MVDEEMGFALYEISLTNILLWWKKHVWISHWINKNRHTIFGLLI